MNPVLIDAQPCISHPLAFLRRARADLRLAPRSAWFLFRANMRAGHRRSLFGFLWLLLPAVTTALVAAYLQSRQVVAVGKTALPYSLHVFAGMVLWQTFLDGFNGPLQQLSAARQAITRSALVHEAILLAGILELMLAALIRGAALLVFAGIIGALPPLAGWPQFVASMAALMALGLTFGLLLAPPGLLYDDLRKGMAVAATLWFFLTPVVYAALPGGILQFNPVTPLLEAGRMAFVAPGLSLSFVICLGAVVIALPLAWLAYRVARPHVVERMG